MLSTTNVKNSYLGDDVTYQWDYTFQILTTDGSDIQVWLLSPLGVYSQVTTSYSIDLVNSQVIYPTPASLLPALASGWTIELRRVEDLKQLVNLVNQGAFDAESLESALDRCVAITQQLKAQVDSIVLTGATPAQVDQLISDLNYNIDAVATLAASALVSKNAAAASAAAALISENNAAAVVAAAALTIPIISSSDAYKIIQVKSDNSGYELTSGNAANRPVIADASNKLPVMDGSQLTGIVSVPSGAINIWTTNTPPSGWLICDGSSVSRTTYATLFSVIGTIYGSADGAHFNLPDLRGNVPVGYKSADGSFGTLGGTGGEKTHTLIASEMPAHTHSYIDPVNGVNGYNVSAGSSKGSVAATTGSAGGNGTHNNLQPYITLTFIIKT